jgi:hypothetical protein
MVHITAPASDQKERHGAIPKATTKTNTRSRRYMEVKLEAMHNTAVERKTIPINWEMRTELS